MAYYGVFDGHAGPKASKFTAEHLHNNIRDRLPKGQFDVFDLHVICQKLRNIDLNLGPYSHQN